MANLDSNISSFIKNLLEIGGCYTVDDSPDKYIRRVSDGKLETCTISDVVYPLAIYGTSATNVLLVNPFAEGESNTVRTSWYYNKLSEGVSIFIIDTIKFLLQTAVDDIKRGEKSRKEKPTPIEIINLLMDHSNLYDEKMLKEFTTITNDPNKFMSIHYNNKDRVGRISCLLFSQAQRKPYSSVRVKSWDTFEGLFLKILKVDNLNKYEYRPQVIGVPVFEAIANLVVEIYSVLTDVAPLIGRTDVTPAKVESLRSHLKYFKEYYEGSKWCVSAIPQAPAATTTTPNGLVQFQPYNFMNGGLAGGVSPTMLPGISTISGTGNAAQQMPQMQPQPSIFQSPVQPNGLPYGVGVMAGAPIMQPIQQVIPMQPQGYFVQQNTIPMMENLPIEKRVNANPFARS